MPAPVRLSRLPVGSSANRIAGRPTSARAIATRWRSPPESFDGECVSRCERPTASSASRARARRSLWRDARVEQPGRDVVERAHPVEQEELLEDEPDRRAPAAPPARARRAPRCPRPATCTEPADGRSSVPITCSSVDLPEPDGPTTATASPVAHRRATRRAAPRRRRDRSCGRRPGAGPRRSLRGHHLLALAQAVALDLDHVVGVQPGLDRHHAAAVGELDARSRRPGGRAAP